MKTQKTMYESPMCETIDLAIEDNFLVSATRNDYDYIEDGFQQ